MTVPAQVLAAVRSIPHPRQEPDMPAPEPSPAEQAVIDRFGIFEPEERWERRVEAAARAICAAAYPNAWTPWDGLAPTVRRRYRRLAAAALTADAALAGQHTTDEEAHRG